MIAFRADYQVLSSDEYGIDAKAMNAPAGLSLLPEEEDLPPPAFHRLLYHYIQAIQQQYPLDNPSLLQPLIDQVDQAIQQTLPKGNPGPSPVPV